MASTKLGSRTNKNYARDSVGRKFNLTDSMQKRVAIDDMSEYGIDKSYSRKPKTMSTRKKKF